MFLARRQYRHADNPSTAILYAPARRIARTIMALGPQDGSAFAMAALGALRSEALGCVHGCEPMAGGYWLLNVMQLRWMLWALKVELGQDWHDALQVRCVLAVLCGQRISW